MTVLCVAHTALKYILPCFRVFHIVPYLSQREETDVDITWRPQMQGRSSITICAKNLFAFILSTAVPILFEVFPFQGPKNVLSAAIHVTSLHRYCARTYG